MATWNLINGLPSKCLVCRGFCLCRIVCHTCTRGLQLHEHNRARQTKHWTSLCAHFVPRSSFSVIFIHSSILIRQETNWGCADFQAARFDSFGRLQGDGMAFVVATGGERVWDLTIMQVTEALWSWGSSQAEGLKETVLFVPSKIREGGW